MEFHTENLISIHTGHEVSLIQDNTGILRDLPSFCSNCKHSPANARNLCSGNLRQSPTNVENTIYHSHLHRQCTAVSSIKRKICFREVNSDWFRWDSDHFMYFRSIFRNWRQKYYSVGIILHYESQLSCCLTIRSIIPLWNMSMYVMALLFKSAMMYVHAVQNVIPGRNEESYSVTTDVNGDIRDQPTPKITWKF